MQDIAFGIFSAAIGMYRGAIQILYGAIRPSDRQGLGICNAAVRVTDGAIRVEHTVEWVNQLHNASGCVDDAQQLIQL